MEIKKMAVKNIRFGILSALLAFAAGQAGAQNMAPGKGVTVTPVQSPQQEEAFQTRVVSQGLKDLGYNVKRTVEVDYATANLAISNGDGTFMAAHWQPLHNAFFDSAGGDAKLSRKGTLSANALQGYLIDKKTADRYKITNIAQMKDPAIAKLFDTNDDGKADLAGCTPGWGCEKIIEHQLDAYKLRATITHKQGAYAALIADVFTRFKEGKPVFYYTWTPYYVSSILVPGRDVVWLQVPFSSLPNDPSASTRLANGKDYGWVANTQHVLANKAFVTANPAAARLFELVNIDVSAINAQNHRMHEGENSSADIDRHVAAWIKANQRTYDGWLAAARAAAPK
ncbi:MAG: glycine betaine/L-proline ABC transporter substrate-binding protein ProX [Pseudomonadota bacterium]